MVNFWNLYNPVNFRFKYCYLNLNDFMIIIVLYVLIYLITNFIRGEIYQYDASITFNVYVSPIFMSHTYPLTSLNLSPVNKLGVYAEPLSTIYPCESRS